LPIQATVYFIFIFLVAYFLTYPENSLKRTLLFLTSMVIELYVLFMYFGNRFLSKYKNNLFYGCFIFYIKYLFKKLELSAVSAVPFKVVPVSKKFPMG
jgi:hypothetical protein